MSSTQPVEPARPVSQPSTVTVSLPWSWFQYSEHGGPPVGSSIGVEGQQGTVQSFHRVADLLHITVELPDTPEALLGVPGDLAGLSVAEPQ